jgi:ABC-2 type transport system permease protein
MNFSLLFSDELRGFYKSKVMMFLWVGLPVVAVLVGFLPNDAPEVPLTAISAIVVSSLAGTLASVMLAVSIINERSRNVYQLFLIRPIKRRDILFAKLSAIYVCVIIASLIAIMVGVAGDYLKTGVIPETVLASTLESLVISFSMLAVSSTVGVLIGVAAPSVLIGSILVIYGGNQISIITAIPALLNLGNSTAIAVGSAITTTIVLLAVALKLFDRKQF